MNSSYKHVICDTTDEMYKAYAESELATWPQPKDITRTDFHSGMLGMCEMESAAERIVKDAQANGLWSPISIDSMKDDHERNGFVELVHGNLLVKYVGHWYYYNGTFIPSRKFVEIMTYGRQPILHVNGRAVTVDQFREHIAPGGKIDYARLRDSEETRLCGISCCHGSPQGICAELSRGLPGKPLTCTCCYPICVNNLTNHGHMSGCPCYVPDAAGY